MKVPNVSCEANERFLAELIARLGDGAAARAYLADDYINYLRAAAAESSDSSIENKMLSRIRSGSYFSNNPFTKDILVPIASRYMGSDFSIVKSIPVGLLPSQTLNGFVACGESGECAVVLNDSILLYALCLFRAYFGYVSWHSDSPHSRSYTQQDYGEALLMLATHDLTYEQDYFKHLAALADEKGRFEQRALYFTFSAFLFILLHEYGHVVNRHLDYSRTSLQTLAKDTKVRVFNRNQFQEFEADKAASQWMLRLDSSAEERESFLLSTGIFMRFMDLVERLRGHSSDTHPPAIERWNQMKVDSGVMKDVDRKSVFEFVDEPFDFLLNEIT